MAEWDDLIGLPAMDYSLPSGYSPDWWSGSGLSGINWNDPAVWNALSYSDYWPGGGLMGTVGTSTGTADLLYDTWTGQFITSAQAQQIDPAAYQDYTDVASRYANTQMAGGTTSLEQPSWPTGSADPSLSGATPSNWTWQDIAKYGIGGASALAGLGTLGLGIGSMFGGSDPANRTTTQTSSTQRNPLSPAAQALLGQPGVLGTPGTAGSPGTPGTPGTGLLGLSDMAIRNLTTGLGPSAGVGGASAAPTFGASAPPTDVPSGRLAQYGWAPIEGLNYTTDPKTGVQTRLPAPSTPTAQSPQPQAGPSGLIGQQANLLGALPSQIPQLNPAITNALQSQAAGMAQGMLPALNDPAAQQRIQAIYQPGFDALNYNAGLALDNAKEALQGRGFAVPDIREGPTQALTAPILAAQQLGRSQLYGQMAGAQLDLASRLPMQAAQLAAQEYGLRQFPFNAALQAAQAYNAPIATQGQIPLSLLDILARQSGSSSTVNTVGPQPSLTQQLGQVAPIIGAGGGLLGTAGQIMFPQQRSTYSGLQIP